MLADVERVHNGKSLFCESKSLRSLNSSSTNERDRAFSPAAAKRGKHRPVILRLGGRNRAVRVTNDRRCNRAALQHHVRLHSEKRWIPDAQIGKFPNLNGPDVARNAL